MNHLCGEDSFLLIPNLQNIFKNSMRKWTDALLEFSYLFVYLFLKLMGENSENVPVPLTPELKILNMKIETKTFRRFSLF